MPLGFMPMLDERWQQYPTIFALLNDNQDLIARLIPILSSVEYRLIACDSTESFENDPTSCQRPSCLLVSMSTSEPSRISFLKRHLQDPNAIPVIVLTDQSDIPIEIAAFTDRSLWICRTTSSANELVEMIDQALALDRQTTEARFKSEFIQSCMAQLSKRQSLVMQRMLAGDPNKVIASTLGVSGRTVELERAEILRIFKAKNAVSLAVMVSESRAAMEGIHWPKLDPPVQDTR